MLYNNIMLEVKLDDFLKFNAAFGIGLFVGQTYGQAFCKVFKVEEVKFNYLKRAELPDEAARLNILQKFIYN